MRSIILALGVGVATLGLTSTAPAGPPQRGGHSAFNRGYSNYGNYNRGYSNYNRGYSNYGNYNRGYSNYNRGYSNFRPSYGYTPYRNFGYSNFGYSNFGYRPGLSFGFSFIR